VADAEDGRKTVLAHADAMERAEFERELGPRGQAAADSAAAWCVPARLNRRVANDVHLIVCTGPLPSSVKKTRFRRWIDVSLTAILRKKVVNST
jgi:hypothetical protein